MAKSALEMGGDFAKTSDEADFVPWFRDDAKLLAAVMLRARDNSSYAAQVIKAVAELVANDKPLRGVLRKALIPTKASKAGRTPRPRWFLMMIMTHLDILSSQGFTKMAARAQVGKRNNLSAEHIRTLEKRARKQRVVGIRANPTTTTGKA